MNEFKSLREKTNCIAYINQGGCAISALAMLRWMRGNGVKDKAQVVFFYDIDMASEYVEGDDIVYLAAPTHAMLCVDKGDHYILYDSERSYKWEGPGHDVNWKFTLVESIFMSEEDALYVINNQTWNDSFDRSSGVPELEKLYKVSLKDVAVN